jgi:hypothetical protein
MKYTVEGGKWAGCWLDPQTQSSVFTRININKEGGCMKQKWMRKSGEGGGRSSKDRLVLFFLSGIGIPETDDSTQGV